MPRWEPQARDRLRDAALELFLADGFDNVTVAQITERAGLTRRTFSRYFTDKRDVLFAGSEQLPAVLAAAVGRADPDLAPFAALLTALAEVGDLVADEHAAERRAIVQASPELQERGLTKFAAVTSALAAALEQRGLRRRPPRSSRRSAPPSSGPRSTAGRSGRNARAWPAVSARRRPS